MNCLKYRSIHFCGGIILTKVREDPSDCIVWSQTGVTCPAVFRLSDVKLGQPKHKGLKKFEEWKTRSCQMCQTLIWNGSKSNTLYLQMVTKTNLKPTYLCNSSDSCDSCDSCDSSDSSDKCDKTQNVTKLRMWQNSECDNTQNVTKLGMWQHSKT